MQEKQRAFLVRTAYWAVWTALLWLGVRYLLRWLLPFILALGLAALFLGVVCSGIAFVIQSVQQQYTTASHVGLIFTLEPVFASMVAFVMTGEVLSLRGYIGAALMLLSLFIMEGDWSFLRRKKHT